MNVSRRVRDQLILSRQLLTTPGPPYSTSSDPSLLARDLIVSYGAAELALAAICVQLDCVPHKKDICLPDYFDSLGKTSPSECAAQEIEYVAELHNVRSNSQLRSLLPDPRRWTRAKEETLEHVTTWCQQFLGVGLFDLDSVPSVTIPPNAFSSEHSASNEKLSLIALRDPDRRRYECFGSADIRLGLVGLLEKGKIANLSPGGCYVETHSPFEVGDQVEMTLHVNKVSFRVTGSVVHVPSSAAVGHRKTTFSGIGVQFMNMSAGSRASLKELIGELNTNGNLRFAKRPVGS
jgi:Tfp pilus assembly protein PilZ